MDKPEDMDHETLMEHVAWDDQSMLELLWQFLAERNLVEAAESYLDKLAIEECNG